MTTKWPRLAGASLAAAIALAEGTAHSDVSVVDCRDGGRTQVEMNACAGQKAAAANKRLGMLLSELDRALEPKAQQGLVVVQRSWAAARDGDCEWERSLFEGGSVAPMVYSYCIASLTEQRIQRLKAFLCEGAGMTGPCEASQKY